MAGSQLEGHTDGSTRIDSTASVPTHHRSMSSGWAATAKIDCGPGDSTIRGLSSRSRTVDSNSTRTE